MNLDEILKIGLRFVHLKMNFAQPCDYRSNDALLDDDLDK